MDEAAALETLGIEQQKEGIPERRDTGATHQLASSAQVKPPGCCAGRGNPGGAGCLPASMGAWMELGAWGRRGHKSFYSILLLSSFNLDFSHFKEKIPNVPSYMSFFCPFSYS